jgi:transposase
MARGISLRSDYNGDDLRSLSRFSPVAKQARRLLVLSLIDDGTPRSEAARHADVSIQTVRDWVLRFNADGPDGLIDGKSTGTPPRLNSAQRKALIRVVESGPVPYLDGMVRWRLCDLASWIHEEYGISLDESTVSRTLRAMGYRKLSARPRHHAQDPEAGPAFKKIPSPSGGNQEQAPGWNDHRNLVAGRGQGREKNKNYPSLGKTRDASLGPQGSANPLGIYLWRYLPGPWRRRGTGSSKMQYCRHDASSAGNICCRRSRSPCHHHRRSSRMALLKSPGDTGQYHPAALAAKMAGTQPGREHLAVHAR